MRCFLAIEVPETLRSRVAGQVDRIREGFPPARWVRPANYHLTLVFLGELEASRVEALSAKLAPVFGAASRRDLLLDRAGWFPPRGAARVLWLGFEARPALDRLVARLARRCADFTGRDPETRPYRPHLTVARCRKPWPRSVAAEWVERMGPLPSHRLGIGRAVLMESRSGTYRVVSSFSFGRLRGAPA